MRTNQDEADYATWLLDLGNGSLQPSQNKKTQSSVVVPADSVCENVMNEFFPDAFDETDAAHASASDSVAVQRRYTRDERANS